VLRDLLSVDQVPTTPDLYTLPLHDALPIYFPTRYVTPASQNSIRTSPCPADGWRICSPSPPGCKRSIVCRSRHSVTRAMATSTSDRKSTRLNSSHDQNSYAVFCLKKKNPTP